MTAIAEATRRCKTCNPGAVHTWMPGPRPGMNDLGGRARSVSNTLYVVEHREAAGQGAGQIPQTAIHGFPCFHFRPRYESDWFLPASAE